ncbi:rab effector MyRIP [Etheostoma spectabile]|uniref:rab effector MyRIP n=1 Tax=Etheostoma spectabile TaxID=54343 RepID=UPI0013AE8D0C|nr:rab effector MyRIP-like [Etheostoma spectabile]
MGRKLDLSGLTDNEAEHVLQVVQRDMRLRKKEEERLSELKLELDEEGSRCVLLSRQRCFNQRCCIRCCSPFTFLLNTKRQCHDCHYNVCKACRVYNKQDKAWLCSACQKSRLLKTQSLEWFYTDVKTRFKRFGSAKVLKTLYRKHLAEHSALSELTEGSAYEESICNEGSVCGSDSTFYRQSQEHSMAETLTVALRVAEEAVDEAISKAESDTANQGKQNEAHYLREHRGELIEELTKTIVQKIISTRKTLAQMRADYDQAWPLEHNTDLYHQFNCDQASSSLKHQPGLWRSHSAFSLLDNDPPGLMQDSSQALKKDGGGSAMSTWKSVDRLDNTGVSSVLKSPDGNWIALQSAQLSRPSLLTKRKSLVFSALERESEVVSAYEGMGSDLETKPEPDRSWGAVLQEIHRMMTDSNSNQQDNRDRMPSVLLGRRGSRGDLFSDSEGNWKPNTPLLALFKRKVPAEIRRPSSSRRTSIIDVNFNVERAGVEVESKAAAEPEVEKVRRSRRKKRSKKDLSSSVLQPQQEENRPSKLLYLAFRITATKYNHLQHLSDSAHEPFHLEDDMTGHGAYRIEQELTLKLHQLAGRVSECSTGGEEEVRDASNDGQREEKKQGSEDRDEEDERLWKMEIDLDEERTEEEEDVDDKEMKYRLFRLIAQSTLTYFSSTDDELDKVGQSKEEWEEDGDEDVNEEKVKKTDSLSSKLCQLEKEVRANQFSSTEDELDRVGVMDEEKKTGEEEQEEEEEEEELAVKVCRLANQANATQFSSTEDELDQAGIGEEGKEAIDEVKLWKLEAEKDVHAAQLRDLASLVSASQFSSTEDELDRVGENEVEVEQEGNEGGIKRKEAVEKNRERRESFGDMDVTMFDLRYEIEERKTESSDEKFKDVQQDQTEVEEHKNCMEEKVTDENEGMVKGHTCEKVEVMKEDKANKAKETEQRQEMESETVVQAEKMEEISLHETKVQLEKWQDKTEGEERQEKISESKESQETATDSDEEDAEFHRIISSMLTMTLDDMQIETSKKEAAENGSKNRKPEEEETDENVKIGFKNGFEETAVDAQSTNESEETESAEWVQSQDDNLMSESAVRERPGENVCEQIQGDISRKNESGDATGKNENEQETDEDAQEKRHLAIKAALKDHDKQGKVTTEWKITEMQEDTAEVAFENKEMNIRLEETKGENADNMEQSSMSSLLEGSLSPEEIQSGSDMELYKTIETISSLLEQRYTAVSLRSITTEVLKVLNATEELLLQGVEGGDGPRLSSTVLPPNTDPKKLDQQFSRLEENVYVAAGEVYSLEAELSDLEECARGICSGTSDMELSFLEEQIASAAAKVQQSELQTSDISARIAALKSAGLNVDPQQSRFTKTKTIPVMPLTLDSSRQLRRRLPAPPVKEDKEET